MDGLRKWWMTAIVVGALVVGLVVAFAFKQMTDPKWNAWCLAVAGTGTAYATANVVTKVVGGKPDKRVKR